MPATKPKILIQLDTDPQPSVFDAVVAVDAGVDHLFRHGGVTPAERSRPGLRGPVHAGPGRPARHRDLCRRLERRGRRGGAGGRQEDVLRPVPGVGALRRQRRQHDRGGGRARGLAELSAARSRASRQPCWRRPARSASAPRGCLPAGGQGRRRLAQPRPRGRARGVPPSIQPRQPRRRLRRDRSGRSHRGPQRQLPSSSPPGPRAPRSCPPRSGKTLPALKTLIDLNAVPPLGIEGDRRDRQETPSAGRSAPGARSASAAPR